MKVMCEEARVSGKEPIFQRCIKNKLHTNVLNNQFRLNEGTHVIISESWDHVDMEMKQQLLN